VHYKFNDEVKGVSIYQDYNGNNPQIGNFFRKAIDAGKKVVNVVTTTAKKVVNTGKKVTDWGKEKFTDAKDWTQDKFVDFNNWIDDLNIDQKIKTALLALPRASFLLLVRLNVGALADLMNVSRYESGTKLTFQEKQEAKKIFDKILAKWYKMGGNRTELARVIEVGAKEKALGANMWPFVNFDYIKKLKASGAISGFFSPRLGATGAEESAAAANAAVIITTLAPLLTALLPYLIKDPNKEALLQSIQSDPEIMALMAKLANKTITKEESIRLALLLKAKSDANKATIQEQIALAELNQKIDTTSNTQSSLTAAFSPKTLLIVGGGALALSLLTKK
jgi:hypothetical protein